MAGKKKTPVLVEGALAPDFELCDMNGLSHALSGISAKLIVVYFYPRDNTPGCTIEARAFNAALKSFEKLGVSIVGISGGDEKSKTKFCTTNKLKILLLSDPDYAVSAAYGAFCPKVFMGRRFKGIFRMTFLLDSNRRVVKVYPEVTPKTHADEVLRDVKSLL